MSLGTKAEAPTVLPCSTVASMTKKSLIMGVYIDIFDLRENISRYLFTYYIQSHGYVIRSLRVAKFPDSIVLKFQFMNPFHKYLQTEFTKHISFFLLFSESISMTLVCKLVSRKYFNEPTIVCLYFFRSPDAAATTVTCVLDAVG